MASPHSPSASPTLVGSDATTIRAALIATLHRVLEAQRSVRGAWLGGSDANGRTDQWSDIDLVTIVEDDAIDQVIGECRKALAAIASIALELRLPLPTWHGHDQVFWQLEDVPDWCMIDCVLIRQGNRVGRFLEAERHGRPVVLFDRDGAIRPEPLDQAVHEAKVRERMAALLPRFDLLQHLVRKAAWRGDPVEAADRYLSYTLRPLVELLRIRYCPVRFDFGLRYLRDDLPESLWREVESLALPASLTEVLEFQARAEAMFRRELAELRCTQHPSTTAS